MNCTCIARDAIAGSSYRWRNWWPTATARGDCNLETLYRRADAALYVAKEAGRNCVAEAEPDSVMPKPEAAP